MRTGDKDATNTKDPRNNDDPHGHLPISQEGSQSIDQLTEKEQKRHLDSEDGDPANDLCGKGQLLVSVDTIHEARRRGVLQYELRRAQDQAHVEVNIFKHDVGERKGSDQRKAAEQQDVVIGKEAVLITKPDEEPADGSEHGCGEEHRDHCLLCFSIVHTLTF